MTINIWENVDTTKRDGWGNQVGNEKTSVNRTVTIDDNEIIALLEKLLLSKKEVLLGLLKQ